MARSTSPLTGLLKEENVVLNFGEHQGKSIMAISADFPEYYEKLLEQKEKCNCFLKRGKDKKTFCLDSNQQYLH